MKPLNLSFRLPIDSASFPYFSDSLPTSFSEGSPSEGVVVVVVVPPVDPVDPEESEEESSLPNFVIWSNPASSLFSFFAASVVLFVASVALLALSATESSPSLLSVVICVCPELCLPNNASVKLLNALAAATNFCMRRFSHLITGVSTLIRP